MSKHCQLTKNSYIQSILFNREEWDTVGARDWLKRHNFKATKVDIKPHFLRYRQEEPGCFERFRNKKFANGIEFIIGFTH